VWTAQMFLMFTLKRENVLPTGDFGVRMAMYRHYIEGKRGEAGKKAAAGKKSVASEKRLNKKKKIKLPTPQQMEKIAQCWAPYRSVACWYLWQSIDTKTL
jgi:DNA-3-methyladenine glycosylase II